MKFRLIALALSSMFALPSAAPQTATSPVTAPTAIAASAPTPVPPLVPYAGVALDAQGKPLADSAAMTFLIYKDEQGGQPLFSEAQIVAIDTTGRYKVQLGAGLASGLPLDLFNSGEARWLEVQIAGQPAEPRVLLVSVPYALKAADAATLGGLPVSAFALVGNKAAGAANTANPGVISDAGANVTTAGGTTGYVPVFNGAASILDSPIFVKGANVGIGITDPTFALQVVGNTVLNGGLAVIGNSSYEGPAVLEPTGKATAAGGFNSQPFKFLASGYNSATAAPVSSHFLWQSEVTANNTAAPSATLNLLTSTTAATPVETGLYFNPNGTINFATGQTFPGTAQLLNNTFVGNQSIIGSATANDSSAAANSAGITGNETAITGLVAGVVGNARSTTPGAAGVSGNESATTGLVYGVLGTANSTTLDAAGVNGVENATTGQVYGVSGSSASSGTNSAGVGGYATSKTGAVAGVNGYAVSTTNGAAGMSAYEGGATGQVFGVNGGTSSTGSGAAGVSGSDYAATGQVFGVVGGAYSTTSGASGVNGYEGGTTGYVFGVSGTTPSAGLNAAGVFGNEQASKGQVYGVNGITYSAGPFAAGAGGYEGSPTGQVYGVIGDAISTTGGSVGVYGNEEATTGVVNGVFGGAFSTTNGAAAINGYEAATSGQVFGVTGTSASATSGAAGVSGNEPASTGVVYGVTGGTNSTTDGAAGVNGYEGSSTGRVYGLSGTATSSTNFAAAVSGYESATTGVVYGVYGGTASNAGVAVQGEDRALTGGTGVSGITRATSGQGAGVIGQAPDTTGLNFGVAGTAGKNGVGVQGGSPHVAVAGFSQDCSSSPCTIASGTAGQFATGTGGLILQGLGGTSLSSLDQVFSVDASGNGFFAGNLNVTGKVSKGSGSFKIDDPLDPAHKYLSHSFVESPDMMDVYNGNITTDRRGVATVELPQYFEALNRDFRYQLTVIGEFAQAIVLKKVDKNHFTIRTSKPGVEVSWQVTGIRHDAYADANRIPNEEDKPANEQGYYLHPEVFGQPVGKSVASARSAVTRITGTN